MSADSLLAPAAIWPETQISPEAAADHAGETVAGLAARFRSVCRLAIDTDEIAAALEASGIGDRVAVSRYGCPDVFALAAELRRRVPLQPVPSVTAPTPLRAAARLAFVRWALYLTPLAVVLGAAREVGLAPVFVTAGVLVLGWAISQTLACLAYAVLARSGPTSAARFLAFGFAVVTAGCLAAVWWLVPLPVRTVSLVVAAGELALFATVAVTLVTGRETRMVRWVLPCWLTAGVLFAVDRWLPGVPIARYAAVAMLLTSLALVLLVAYRPVIGRGGGWRWPFQLPDAGRAVGHTVVGLSQASLFVVILLGSPGALNGSGGWREHVPLLPLLLATPLTEVVVVRLRERLSRVLHVFEDVGSFRRYARRAVARSLTALAGPVVLGGGVAVGVAVAWQQPELLRYGVAFALAGLFAVTLLIALHHRLALAVLLIATPAVLIGGAALALLAIDWRYQAYRPSEAVLTLLPAEFGLLTGAFGVGLVLSGFVLLDPRGYR